MPPAPLSSPLRRRRARAALCTLLSVGGATRDVVASVPWEDTIALAEELRVLPSLWGVVRGEVEVLPPDVRRRLRAAHTWNVARNLAFAKALVTILATWNEAGITPMLLKGSLLLAQDDAGDPGWRWMADLDLLVPQNRWSEAVERLEQIGYRIHASEYPDPHEVALLRDDVPGAVEVHGRIGDPRLMAVMPAEDLWRASSPLSVGATTARAPSPTDQVLHCVLHAGVQDEHHVFGDLPLRQLLTLARLLEAEQGAVEWEELARRASEHGHERVVRAYVALAHELLGAPVPSGWTEDWRSRAHRRRVLTCFLLRWPSTLPRNVRDALERDRLDTLYHHGNRPVPLAWARLRHLVRTLRSRGWAASRDEALKSPS